MGATLRIETYVNDIDEAEQIDGISLIDGLDKIWLEDWQPGIASSKNGGTWIDNPMSDGRRLALRRLGNVVESMVLAVGQSDHVAVVQATRKLRQLLEKASTFFTNQWQTQPVWLKAQEEGEDNPRYAIIYDYIAPEDSSALLGPFSCPQVAGNKLAMLNFRLGLERGAWKSELPSHSHCVEASTLATCESEAWASRTALAGFGLGGPHLFDEPVSRRLFSLDGDSITWTQDGFAWNRVVAAAGGEFQSFAAGTNGYLYAAGYLPGPGTTMLYRSGDLGVTWGTGAWATAAGGWNYGGVGLAVVDNFLYVAQFYTVAPMVPADAGLWKMNLTTGVWTQELALANAYGVWYLPMTDVVVVSYASASGGPHLIWSPRPTGPTTWTEIDVSSKVSSGSFYALQLTEYAAGRIFAVANNAWPGVGQRWICLLTNQPTWAFNAVYDLGFGAVCTAIANWSARGTLVATEGAGTVTISLDGGQTWEPSQWLAPVLANTGAAEFTVDDNLYIGRVGGVSGIWAEGAAIQAGNQETCDPQNFWRAGYQSLQLTHIFRYDASVPSYTQLFGQGQGCASFDLLPPVPAVGDIIYFGIDSSLVSAGAPLFSNLIFDLERPLSDSAGAALTAVWEFWNGAWVALPNLQDNTNALQLASGGVMSMWFRPNGLWATTAVNGITALWVRLRVTVAAATALSPRQQNRDVYTVTQGYIEIADDQALGDLPALARHVMANVSDHAGMLGWHADAAGTGPGAPWNRFVMGLRSLSRGPQFQAYLPFSDIQEPPGVTTSVLTARSVFSTAIPEWARTATGRFVLYTAAALDTSYRPEFKVRLGQDVAYQFAGTFAMFVRLEGVAQSAYIKFNITAGQFGASVFTPEVYLGRIQNDVVAIPLGLVTLPPYAVFDPLTKPDYIDITCHVYPRAACAVSFYDIVLIPVDEWSVDCQDSGRVYDSAIDTGNYLDVDSVLVPSELLPLRASGRSVATGNVFNMLTAVGGSEVILQHHEAQRLWFLPMRGVIYGTHSAPANSPDLIISGYDLTRLGIRLGSFVYNLSDGSQGVITSVSSTTVVAALYGGTENDWDIGELYAIVGANFASAPWYGGSYQGFSVDRFLSYRGD